MVAFPGRDGRLVGFRIALEPVGAVGHRRACGFGACRRCRSTGQPDLQMSDGEADDLIDTHAIWEVIMRRWSFAGFVNGERASLKRGSTRLIVGCPTARPE